MSRAALLPTPGDPYIVAAWLNLFHRVWARDINKLYIHLNSRLEDPVIDYVKQLCLSCNANITYTKNWMGHGQALKEIFDKSTEDYIFLAEDDGYITRPGVVNSCFQMLEQGQTDCIVTPRGSCTESLRLREVEYWGLTGELWYKPNFWPCFFFSHRRHLDGCHNLATFDVDAGTYIQQVEWTAPEHISMDTFGEASMDLRNRGLRFQYYHDGRSTTEDFHLAPSKQGIFASPPIAPWVHFGSTSSGISGSLLDENLVPLENRCAHGKPTKLPAIPDDHIRDDYERRVSLWVLCFEHFPIPVDSPASYFNQIYWDALERLIIGCQLNRDRLNTYKQIYTDLLAPMWKK